jgi:hypothetical protein
MQMTFRTVLVFGVAALAGVSLGVTPAHAQCCGGGGGGYRGGFGGGHTFAQTAYGGYGGSCCHGMSMGGTAMPAMQAPAASMPGMNMSGYAYTQAPVTAAPATAAPAATARYHCPMHPSVVTSYPATCPYCGMALTRM